MAFTGSAVVSKISDRMFRITGLSLAPAAAGTIGLDGGTGEVDLATGAAWGAYGGPAAAVPLADSVNVQVNLVGAAVVAPSVRVSKAGTTVADFLLTLTNSGGADTTELEILVSFH